MLGHKKARAAQQPAHLMQMPMMQTMLPWGAMNPMQGMNPMMAPMGMQGMMMNPMMAPAQQQPVDLESEGSEEAPVVPTQASSRPSAAQPIAAAQLVDANDTQQQAISGLAKSRAALFLTDGQGGQVITRSAAMLRSLPKRKLSEAVEALDECLDPTVTSDLSTAGLVRVLWLLSRQFRGESI